MHMCASQERLAHRQPPVHFQGQARPDSPCYPTAGSPPSPIPPLRHLQATSTDSSMPGAHAEQQSALPLQTSAGRPQCTGTELGGLPHQ